MKAPLLDLNSTRIFSHDEVYELAFSKIPPRSTDLYVIHDLYPAEGADHDGHWLHTHGLNRAGMPEFELLNMPARYTAAGGDLMVAAIDLLLGGGTPPLRKTIQIGAGLKVSVLEWEKFVFQLPLEVVGGMHSRSLGGGVEDVFHTGYRVAIVSQKPKGFFKKKWTLPLTVLSAIAKGEEDKIWKSTSEVERIRILSNDRWHLFVKLWETKNPAWKCRVKLGCPVDSTASRHEYLWFTVRELLTDSIKGDLAMPPSAHLTKRVKLAAGEQQSLERIAEWKIVTPDGDFGPEDAEALLAGDSKAAHKAHEKSKSAVHSQPASGGAEPRLVVPSS